MRNIYNETLGSLEETIHKSGYKAYSAKQIFDWIYKKNVRDFGKMTNIAKPLRVFLAENFRFGNLTVFTKQVSKDQTRKYLFALEDNHLIETVLMAHDYGNSLCITTQVGCNIGCSFCASGLRKKVRNLTVAEMVMQFIGVQEDTNQRISHVVIMGTGEPFDNYQNVIDFIDIVNSPYGIEIGARHITVSTSGIIPKIEAFSREPKQVNLAISLHAANDTLRSKLMKINDVYPVKELIKSVQNYIDKTHRRVTFEYILLRDVNDAIADADELSDLLRGINCYVNLIRYNAVKEFSYQPSDEKQAFAFYQRLLKRGIQATLRKEMGSDIDAACGQLRAKTTQ